VVVSGGGCDAAAAWRGAFLARGLLSEPCGSCSLEVAAPGPEAALALIGAARRPGCGHQEQAGSRCGAGRAVRASNAIGELLGSWGHRRALAWQPRQLRRQSRSICWLRDGCGWSIRRRRWENLARLATRR